MKVENHLTRKGRVGLRGEARPLISKRLWQQRTTAFERFLLLMTIMALPLQPYIPTVEGMSVLFFMFAFLAGYVLAFRLKVLVKTLRHPVFLAVYTLLGIGLFLEIAHGSSGYAELLRIAFMTMGAIIIASLCRDRRALLFGMYGFLLAGMWLSIVLFSTNYSHLSSVKVDNFKEAEQFRYTVLEKEDTVTADLNDMAFIAGRGALVALVFALTTGGSLRRYSFLAIGTFCLIAAFLPMSRSGLVMLAVSGASVLYVYGIMRPRVVMAVGVLAIAVLMLVPASVYSRYTFSTEKHSGQYKDSRARVYSTVVEHLPEYVLTGVGISHFYGEWGRRNGFLNHRGVVFGTHNCFAQVTVYWGLAGFLALLTIFWQAYRFLPKPSGGDALRLCLLGIVVSVMVYSFVVHTLFAKEFSFALGLLVGSSRWIWPQLPVAQSGSQNWTLPLHASPGA